MGKSFSELKVITPESPSESEVRPKDGNKSGEDEKSSPDQDLVRSSPSSILSSKEELEKKVSQEFLDNPSKQIDRKFINFITPETVAKIDPTQTINPEIMNNLSIPQLISLHPEIIVNYLLDHMNLSIPMERQSFSKNLDYFLTPKSDDIEYAQPTEYLEHNQRVRKIYNQLLPKLKGKINSEFSKNPTMNLDSSYVQYLSSETLQKLNPETVLNSAVIDAMNIEQLEALPSKIIIQYLVKDTNLEKSKEEQTYSLNIQKFLEKNVQKIDAEFTKQLAQKVNNSIEKNITLKLNPDFLLFLTPENMKKFAEYQANNIDLETEKENNQFLQKYKSDKDFNKSFIAKLKERINKQFSKYPNWKLDPSFVPFIDIGTIKNLKLSENQTINREIYKEMSAKQQKAFQPETLKQFFKGFFKN